MNKIKKHKVYHFSKPKIPAVFHVLGDYTAVDLEWVTDTHEVVAASFVNNHEEKKVFLKSDFRNSEIALLERIKAELLEYKLSMGWNSSTSIDNNNTNDTIDENGTTNGSFTNDIQCDLGILYERCEANGLYNIVKKYRGKGSKTYYDIPGLRHIDLYRVYSKEMVKYTIYNCRYRTNKLHDVATALLEHGKYKDVSGKDFLKLTINDQRKYVLRDSELVMKLSKYNNYEVLDAMFAISEIIGLEFERVCSTRLTTWWGNIFNQMVNRGECSRQLNIFDKEHAEKYKGALVLYPKQGLYHNTVVVDASSLYPTMAIHYNLSFDTVNCQCCKKNPRAKVKLNEEFFNGCKYITKDNCWICQKNKEGAFPKKLKVFKCERLEQKKLGNHAKQLALKILINGGYGVFGFPDFSYYDPYVAELITTYGRYTLSKMEDIARKLGFKIIYGDTDSLFLDNVLSASSLSKFHKSCKEQLDIDLETKNTYSKLILSRNKKHYIGLEKGQIDIVGYEGKKSNRCEFVHDVFNKVVNNILKNNKNPIPSLTKAMYDLDLGKVNPKLLTKSMTLGMNPEDYPCQTSQAAKIGHAVGGRQGELVEYFDADLKKTGKSWTKNPRHIDIPKYKQALWNTVSEVLEITGYPIENLAEKFGVNMVLNVKNENKTGRNESKRTKSKVVTMMQYLPVV